MMASSSFYVPNGFGIGNPNQIDDCRPDFRSILPKTSVVFRTDVAFCYVFGSC